MRNQIRCEIDFSQTSIPCEGIEDFRIVDVICCVWGKELTIDQHILTRNANNRFQLSAWDEKPIPALKKTFYGTRPTLFHTWFLLYSQSTEITRGPPELVQHFRLWGSSHRRKSAACPKLVNLTWFGWIAGLPYPSGEERGGVGTLWLYSKNRFPPHNPS